MRQLAREGAEGIILGCTELSLLLKQEDAPVPLFDSTRLHVRAAVDFAISDPNAEFEKPSKYKY